MLCTTRSYLSARVLCTLSFFSWKRLYDSWVFKGRLSNKILLNWLAEEDREADAEGADKELLVVQGKLLTLNTQLAQKSLMQVRNSSPNF